MILSNDGLVAFHYRSYGTFFYNKIDSIIPMVVLPTTEIIESQKQYTMWYNLLMAYSIDFRKKFSLIVSEHVV